jgi:hypothetical protein
VNKDDGIFETYELCRSALLRQTLLDKVFKAVESQHEVRACTAQIEKLTSCAHDPSTSADLNTLNELSLAQFAKYDTMIISPVAALSDAHIKEMSDALRTDQRSSTTVSCVSLDRLCSTFRALFPMLVTDEMRDNEISSNDHRAMAEMPPNQRRENFEKELVDIKTTLTELQLVVQRQKLDMEKHSLSFQMMTMERSSSTTRVNPRDMAWHDHWRGRLRVTGRRRRRTTVLVDNLQKNDIILQRFGNTCEVDRLY